MCIKLSKNLSFKFYKSIDLYKSDFEQTFKHYFKSDTFFLLQTFKVDFIDVLNLNRLQLNDEFYSIYLHKIQKEYRVTIITIFKKNKKEYKLDKLVYEYIFQMNLHYFFNLSKRFQDCLYFKIGDFCLPPKMYNRYDTNKIWKINFKM